MKALSPSGFWGYEDIGAFLLGGLVRRSVAALEIEGPGLMNVILSRSNQHSGMVGEW